MVRDSPLVFRIYARSANILYYDFVTGQARFPEKSAFSGKL